MRRLTEDGAAAVLSADQVHIWVWRGPTGILPARYFDVLSEEERRRAKRFMSDRDRDRFVVSHAGARYVLSELLDVAAPAVRFTTDAGGKPRLAESIVPPIFFNLSHSHDLAAIAVSSTFEVGLDIECVPESNPDDMIPFFSKAEQTEIARLPQPARKLGIFNAWTRKEAFLKAIGTGLTVPLDDFDVSLVPGEPARLLRLGHAEHEADKWQLAHIIPAPGYVGAVAAPVVGWQVILHNFAVPR